MRHPSFVQSVDGVPEFGNGVKADVARDVRLISVLGSTARCPLRRSARSTARAAARISPSVSTPEAVSTWSSRVRHTSGSVSYASSTRTP
ncbi:hypothetical protein [Streptomyces sp. NL15-2K]|uniref:hypothetical protein n=1 Tax=Streptomyces sp. NL15-2K TaxID=376149 RepID=UPI00209BD509|nr:MULTISPECIES: hypothetical protein [Actinomycetes]WKX16160.1 hypothetical protein Q4V64_22285 [Kutzneria buriramensis]